MEHDVQECPDVLIETEISLRFAKLTAFAMSSTSFTVIEYAYTMQARTMHL